MSFRKNIDPENVLISSFEVNKTFTFNDTDSGSGFFSVPLIKGSDSNLSNFQIGTAVSSTFSGSTYFHVPTYQQINNLYYKDIRNIRGYVDLIRGVPTSSNGVVTYPVERPLTNTVRELKRPFTRQLHDTATLISVPQRFFGESIKPGSITLTDDSTAQTFILKDDSYGNLYDVAHSASYASRVPTSTYSGSVVGNVFYNDGVIVITDTGSYSTVATDDGADGFSLKFNSTQTIYEREYVCVVGENELQHTTNKSLKVGRSGSFTMGTFVSSSLRGTRQDGWPYFITGYSTSSMNNNGYNMGTELIGEATHSHFATYITEIGLYNDSNELLAVGKLAKPIKNDKELALTFVVRFDTN
ncbi:MAG: hypothetical protein CBE47_01850 [Pelagibacteraceae bacterium TMED287]|nr:MAG: hypothetical protein CBE47_01850 [Pelagibacteraceae bacterium TMED287]